MLRGGAGTRGGRAALHERQGHSLAAPRKPIPQPTPETQEFWDGVKAGELRLQRCQEAGCAQAYFPPRPFCPSCGSRNVATFKASGRGTLHSYVINQRPAPGFTGPYAIAVVKLDEGPKMMTNISGVEQTPEALVLDMPVEMAPEEASETISLPIFRPVGGGA